ncbi:ARCA protein [Ilyonectria robusta]
MAPQPRKRTVPCDKCRGDGGTPCSNCSKASTSCVRMVKKFRVKRLITSHDSFKFDPDQTWIQTGSQSKCGLILDATGWLTKPRATTLPLHHRRIRRRLQSHDPKTYPPIDEPEESCLSAAAEVLQSFSRSGQARPYENATSHSTLDEDESLDTSPRDGLLERCNIQDTASTDDNGSHSQFSTPSTSTYDQTPVPPYLEPSRGLPNDFHSVWQHSHPDSSLADSVDHASSHSDSPYQTNYLIHQRLPSRSVSDYATPASIPGVSNSGNPLAWNLQEACLVRCFIETIATSFDTSDRDHHYLNVVPIRAMYSPLLLNAICTASARYLTQIWSRREPHSIVSYNGTELPGLTEESVIHYHNKCISELMDVSADPINSCSDDALTAITILRYHEQVDTHFTGIDGETFSIAVQAVFQAQQDRSLGQWRLTLQPPRDRDMFAVSMPSLRHSACLIALRQEIWSVLIHRRPFRLPILTVDDYANFDDTSTLDDHDWTNCVIFWCAHVLKFCFSDEGFLSVENKRTRSEQWNALKAFEKNWDERPPPHFAPLYYEERNPSEGRYFPTIWLANHSQVMALQHVELARIVLAVHDSKLQRIGIGASAAYQALEEVLMQSTRRICALGMGDLKFQATMVTAGVGISMCGEYFHDAGEQAAIINVLTTLESQHAWPTSTAVDALQTAWNEHRARNT